MTNQWYTILYNVVVSWNKEILIISTPEAISQYEELLGDGTKLGISLQYKVQEKPRGLAEAFILGEDFIKRFSMLNIRR